MKHLYNLNSNSELLNLSPKNNTFNNKLSLEDDKDINLLTSLCLFDTDDDEEPDDDLIQFLFNYSSSLGVHHSAVSDTVCVYNKN